MDAMTEISIVTGAASGMGLACAHRFTAHPGSLVVVDRDGDRVAEVASELDATPFTCDVTDAEQVAALAELVASMGSFRRLAHAAGISPTMADPLTIWDVDLRGSALVLDAFDAMVVPGSVAVCFASIAAATLAAAGDPEIDAVADRPLAPDLLDRLRAIGGPMATDPAVAYGWAKRGVQRLSRRTAVAWGPRGGRVVSMSPGIIDTPMGSQEADAQPMMEFMVEHTPLRRIGTPDELAAVVDFLCSDDAAFITGVDLTVDGGVMAGLESLAMPTD